MFSKTYLFQVNYVTGHGIKKSAIVKSKNEKEMDVTLLIEVTRKAKDYFIQDYEIIPLGLEEKKLSVFDK